MLRNLMLKAADSPSLVRLFSSLGHRSGLSGRFVAGEDVESAIEAVRQLNKHRICASLDLLGEGVTVAEEAERARDGYIKLLEAIQASGVDSNISIKLTQIGLDIDQRLCTDNLRAVLEKARQLGNFVRIDMESSAHTQRTLDVFRDQFAEFGRPHVGVVLQSYLYRTSQDVQDLVPLACNIRLCKGAYKEPPEIAFPKKTDVDRNFVALLEKMLESPLYTAIASHDESIISHARTFIAARNIPPDRYEFQMLYGVRRDLQLQLREEGYKVRVYVPFGTQWAPYFMRRLAERPANVLFITRAIFRR